ncbi:MAG: S8 family peptidase [Ilumatobacteraceae bacterium]
MLEFHSTIDADEVRRTGLTVLDGSNRHAVVAFSDDPTLALFHERLATYRGPIPDDQELPVYQSFFDSISAIRPYGPSDRISSTCEAYVASLESIVELRLDVQCWHPDNSTMASVWLQELRSAVHAAGGRVASTYQNDPVGLLLARVYLASNMLSDLAEIDVIALINLLPATDLSKIELYNFNIDDLPPMESPSPNAPILGLIDSGVASAHPLLVGAVLEAEALSPYIADGEDRNGHGTMVASLALHGPIAVAIRQPKLVPIARIVSVAVLDSQGLFPNESLWEQDLAEAIEYCAQRGARVINLSIGDDRRPFIPPRQHAISALVDHLARIYNVVIVAVTGNSNPQQYVNNQNDDPSRTYLADLLNHPETGILPPGTAALALTVGGLTTAVAAGGYTTIDPIERRPYGDRNWPSIITRRGPGVGDSTKPELVAPSGTYGFEPGRPFVRDDELGVIGATIGLSGRLLGTSIGTSFAAPLVSRVALAVLSRFPEFSANLVRALVLLGAESVWDGQDLGELAEADRARAVRMVTGFGQTSIEGASEVGSHRVVLVAEGEINMNDTHIYELPIPTSFCAPGGMRHICVSLCFDPPVRIQRLDYLGNKMEFYLVRGIGMQEVLEVFTKLEADDLTDTNSDDFDDLDTSTPKVPVAISSLGRKNVKFDIPGTFRSRSTNQLGRVRLPRKWNENDPAYLVVRSVNRWCDDELKQNYALSVSLRRDFDQPEIYTELAAKLEAIAEIEIELRAEV